MKKLKIKQATYLCCLMLVVCWAGCETDEGENKGDNPDTPTVEISVTTEAVESRTEKTVKAIGSVSGLTEGDQSATYGICYSYSNIAPNIQDDQKVAATELQNGGFSVTITGLTGGTSYNYRAYVLYENKCYYGKSKVFLTRPADDGNDVPTPGQVVDLGLSIKWAGWNIGATKPEEYGGLYGWGDPSGTLQWQCWNSMGAAYKPEADCFALYGGENPPGNICGTQLDIARAKWGDTWKLPSDIELQELINSCNWKTITYKGIVGRLIIGPNGNKIFLPSAGRRSGTETFSQNEQARYWSGILEPAKNINLESLKGKLAYMLAYEKNEVIPGSKISSTGVYRYIGASVRPVKK